MGLKGIRPGSAGVRFEGDLTSGYRACLWSRVASRVLLTLGAPKADSQEAVYDAVQSIDWATHLTPANTLAVSAVCRDAPIRDVRYATVLVKDAIVDQLRDQSGQRPSIDRECPDVRVNAYLHRNQVILSLDLSGTALHLRGYRREGALAPLKENLAAACLRLAGWPAMAARAPPSWTPCAAPAPW